jgi:uncharacterized protein
MVESAGYGIGLRASHYRDAFERGLGVPWVEAITENFLGRGGRPPALLERLRSETRLALHGVSLSIGGMDPIDARYLAGMRELVQRFEPEIVSDHLCFSGFAGKRGHDLWPIPYTAESLAHVARRVDAVQTSLGRRIALENPSRYVAFADDALPEWHFLNELAKRTGCGILLDVNNVHVSAFNLGFDVEEYLAGIAMDRVVQYHVAGHQDNGKYLLDDHGSPVADVVWDYFARVQARCPGAPVIVEWDGDVPPLSTVVAEAEKAARIITQCRVAA